MSKFTIHNCGFMGCMREEGSQIDGHYTIVLHKDKFAILSANGYGGFDYLGSPMAIEKLNEPSYRFLHDAILYFDDIYKIDINDDDIDIPDNLIWYDYLGKPISANIGHLDYDNVIDVRTNEILDLSYCDLRIVNRNPHYQLIDRPHLNPKPMKKVDLINKINEAKEKIFSCVDSWNWKPSQEPTKKRFGYINKNLGFTVDIDGVIAKYETWWCAYTGNSTYTTYIFKETIGDRVRIVEHTSSIYADAADFLDLLTYRVCGTVNRHINGEFYSLYNIDSESDKYGKRFKTVLFDDEESLEYTHRSTFI